MKNKIIVLSIAGALITGAGAGAAGNYFFLNGFNEELKTQLSPEIEKGIQQIAARKQEVNGFRNEYTEKEKQRAKKETEKHLKEAIQFQIDSQGKEQELEMQIKQEADEIIEEVNAYIDTRLSGN